MTATGRNQPNSPLHPVNFDSPARRGQKKTNREQVPQHNVVAEQRLLGSLLRDPEYVALKIREQLLPKDFSEDRHQRIVRAAFDLIDCGHKPDLASVYARLVESGEANDTGSHAYLTHLYISV